MILIRSPRSVYDTTSNRRLKDSPSENEPRFFEGVIRIVNRDFKWICEDRGSFFKRNVVALLVEKVLTLVPFNGAFSATVRQVTVSIFV